MTCNVSACNAKILARMDKTRSINDFTRKKLYADLRDFAGTLYYLAAPRVIPIEDEEGNPITEVTTEVKEYPKLPVLHLDMRICSDGTLTDNTEWEGIKAGTYIEDRAFIIVKVDDKRAEEVSGSDLVTFSFQEKISNKEAANPVRLLIKKGVLQFNYLGTEKAQWAYQDGKIVKASRVAEPTIDKNSLLEKLAMILTDEEIAYLVSLKD